MDLKKLLDEIKAMTVMELNEFVKMLETEFGVSAAAVAVAAPAGGAAAADAAPAEEEKTEFAVLLKEVGANKIAVIKAVKEITGLGIGEAKALVDNAPSTIKDNVPKDACKDMVEKLKAAGATVELK